MKKIIIIDGNSLAYTRIPDPEKFKDKFIKSSKDGRDIFITRKFIKKMLRYKYIVFSGYHLMVVFDQQNKFTFRHELDPKYKSKTLNAKRQKQKDYVYNQIEDIKKVLDVLNVPYYSSPDWEADDIIGMMVTSLEKKNMLSTIISGDKDILQLISPKTRVQYNTPNNDSVLTSRNNVWDISGGVWPDQVIEMKILAGDNSDNIKGLGIIRKGKIDYWTNEEAANLIKKWDSIPNMIKNVDKLDKELGSSLIKGKEKIEHNRKLVTIVREWSLDDVDIDYFLNKEIDKSKIEEVLEDLNLQEMMNNKRFVKGIK